MVHYFEPTEIEKKILNKTDSIYTNLLELFRNNGKTGGKKLLLRLSDQVILNEPFKTIVNDIIDTSSTGIYVNSEINSKYIPEDLRAKNPSELAYCLSVNESYHEIDEKWYGFAVGFTLIRRRCKLNIEIIDVMSRKSIGEKTFYGPSPPPFPKKYNFKLNETHHYLDGGSVDENEVKRWIIKIINRIEQ